MSAQVLVALRRVTRAIDLHCRKLVQSQGITGHQVLVLKEKRFAARLDARQD